MDFKIIKTDNNHPDFMELIKLLDEDLYQRYGDLQKEYDKHNKVDYIKDVLIIKSITVETFAFKQIFLSSNCM